MGWHITGTAGVFGAAAGAGRIVGLDAARMNMALGVAGTFAAGVREVFGSHAKALHPAKAASNGLQAAYLAGHGFTGADDILGGRRGFWAVLSPGGHREEALLGGLGERWELRNNGLKPYANGVVSHPIQDAVIALRNEHGLRPDRVASIDARVHPLVLELMDRPRAAARARGQVLSFQHCAAGRARRRRGPRRPVLRRARGGPPSSPPSAPGCAPRSTTGSARTRCALAITLNDGTILARHVEHATGSPENPHERRGPSSPSTAT